jgi:hypothetical protein
VQNLQLIDTPEAKLALRVGCVVYLSLLIVLQRKQSDQAIDETEVKYHSFQIKLLLTLNMLYSASMSLSKDCSPQHYLTSCSRKRNLEA